MPKKPELRMYGFTLYNISEIQKGIQFGHAVVEYANKYSKDLDYKLWTRRDKTFIILNGGTTNSNYRKERPLDPMQPYQGSLDNLEFMCLRNKIKHATFNEPDLNNALTAFVFLVDEKVFNKVKYPDFDITRYINDTERQIGYDKWVKKIGKKNLFLREFLKGKKLA